MKNGAELKYVLNVLKKMRLQTVILSRGDQRERLPDMGLRRVLGFDDEYARDAFEVKDRTVYKITDEFFCRYVALLLPDEEAERALLIGPYMSVEPTAEQLMERTEQLGLIAAQLPFLKRYYANIPILTDDGNLMLLMNTFAETVWGEGNAYRIEEINREGITPDFSANTSQADPQESVLMQMKVMEQRYAYENELIDMVSKGLTHRAKMLLNGTTVTMMEQRVADSVRNTKNYLIICNTILRKAAQQGGVHPYYLDRDSSAFAMRIELIHSADEGQKLMGEMILSYCRLVRRHNDNRYSPTVQKATTFIDSQLSGDLHLRRLAEELSVSPGHLCDIFHKETGRTVTQYVTDARMKAAANLLRSTQLQVQTVAQHCGIGDVNYFSKVFKRHFGVTPRQYREKQVTSNS